MKQKLIKKAYRRVLKRNFKDTKSEFKISENDPVQALGQKVSTEVFNGGPIDKFSLIGRLYLITLLKIGLNPDSKVLDIGCGALRGGYWLIHFLNPKHYFGIEPNKEMLNKGKDIMLSDDVLSYKIPQFDHNSDFDFSVFNEKFDYMIARSIWTHTSKSQIEIMLDQFVKNSNPKGVFLASYLRSYNLMKDYQGTEWVGKSHDSEDRGIVYHDFAWIESECMRRNLHVEELKFDYVDQIWLYIQKK